MLAKSKKSAFIMGGIFVLTAFVLSVVGDIALPTVDPLISQESVRNTPFLGWLALAFVLLLAIGAMAAFVYERDESHFGPQGATRWAIAGVIYALLVKGVSLLFSRFEGQMLDSFIKSILQILVMGLAYWIVFQVCAPRGTKMS